MSKLAVRKCNRSGTQICPVCERNSILIEHHIHGREIHGANSKSNLVWICASCHDKVHAGLVIIEGWFNTTAGRELFWHHRGEANKLVDGAIPPMYND